MNNNDFLKIWLAIVALGIVVRVGVFGNIPSFSNGWFFAAEVVVLAVLIILFSRTLPVYATLNKAEAARKKKDYAQALKLCMEGIAKYPKATNFYTLASAVYAGMRQWDEAIDMASKAIAINAKSPIAWNNRAFVYMQLGDFKAAEHDSYHAAENAKKQLALGNTMVVFQTRAAVYIVNCKYEEALADAECLVRRGQKARGFYIRAVVMTCLNRFEEAIEYCDKALSVTKDRTLHAHVLAARAAACHSLGRQEEAMTDIDIAIREEPTHYQHQITCAHILARVGRYEDAARQLAMVEQVELSTLELAILLSNKARVEVLTGHSNRACHLAAEALQLRPDSPALLCTHAWTLQSAGNYIAARANLSKAIEIDKNYAEAYWLRSQVYMALGNEEGADADRAIADKLRYRPYVQIMQAPATDGGAVIRVREKQSEART